MSAEEVYRTQQRRAHGVAPMDPETRLRALETHRRRAGMAPEERLADEKRVDAEYRAAHIVEIKARGRHYRALNKPQAKARSDAQYRAHPERWSDGQRLRLYGVTPEAFRALLERAAYRCQICNSTEFGKKGPQIDHDHVTGRIRGILCQCNSLIGRLGDRLDYIEEWVTRFIDYLRGERSFDVRRPPPATTAGWFSAKTLRPHLLQRYRLSVEDYALMLIEAGYQCQCCGRGWLGKQRPVIDHDHDTGRIRGILCIRCNVLVGQLGDTEPRILETLERIRAYFALPPFEFQSQS